MIQISRPETAESPSFYHNYINSVPKGNLLELYKKEFAKTMKLCRSLSSEQIVYRYAAGKWNFKEILVHLMDAERIFLYRALRISRKDQTPLASFDENQYVQNLDLSGRSLESIVKEFRTIRASTIAFFENLDEEQLLMKGIASNREISVRALAYIIMGHEIHHRKVFQERYL